MYTFALVYIVDSDREVVDLESDNEGDEDDKVGDEREKCAIIDSTGEEYISMGVEKDGRLVETQSDPATETKLQNQCSPQATPNDFLPATYEKSGLENVANDPALPHENASMHDGIGVDTGSDTDPGGDGNGDSGSEFTDGDDLKSFEEEGALSDVEQRRELDRKLEIGIMHSNYEGNRKWPKKEKRKKRKKRRDRNKKSRRRRSQEEDVDKSDSQLEILPVEVSVSPLAEDSANGMMGPLENTISLSPTNHDMILPAIENDENSVQPGEPFSPVRATPVNGQDIETETAEAMQADKDNPAPLVPKYKTKKIGKRPKPANWMWKQKSRRRRPKKSGKATKTIQRPNPSSIEMVPETPTLLEDAHDDSVEQPGGKNPTEDGYQEEEPTHEFSVVCDNQLPLENPEERLTSQEEVVRNETISMKVTEGEDEVQKIKKPRRPANWMWTYPRKKRDRFQKRRSTGSTKRSAKRSRMDNIAAQSLLPVKIGEESDELRTNIDGDENVDIEMGDVLRGSSSSTEDKSIKKHEGINPNDKMLVLYKCPFCFLIYPESGGLIQHLPVHSKNAVIVNAPAEVLSNSRPVDSAQDGTGNYPESEPSKTNGGSDDIFEPTYVCKICGKQFALKYSLSVHRRFAHGKRDKNNHSQGVPEPGQSTSSAENPALFQAPQNQPTRAEGSKPFNCAQCSGSFGTLLNLKNHSRVHDSSRPLKCSRCRCYFQSTSRLYNHERLLHGIRRVKMTGSGKNVHRRHAKIRKFTNMDPTQTSRPLRSTDLKLCEIIPGKLSKVGKLPGKVRATRKNNVSVGSPSNDWVPEIHSCCMEDANGMEKQVKLSKGASTSSNVENANPPSPSQIQTPILGDMDDDKKLKRSRKSGLIVRKRMLAQMKDKNDNCNGEVVHNNDNEDNQEGRNANVASSKSKRVNQTGGQGSWKCEVCGKSLSAFHVKLVHMRIHTGQKPFKCDKCNYSCRQISNLQKHEKFHDPSLPWKCSQCPLYFPAKCGLTLHRARMHGKRAESSGNRVRVQKMPETRICEVVLIRCDHMLPFHGDSRTDSKISSEPSRTDAVEDVPEMTKRKAGMNARMQIKAQMEDADDLVEKKCPQVNITPFPSPAQNITLHRCLKCPKAFPYKCNLQRHVLNIHLGAGRRYACGTCNARFPTVGKLKQHTLAHSNI